MLKKLPVFFYAFATGAAIFLANGAKADSWSKPTITAESLNMSASDATKKGQSVVLAWDKCDYGFGGMQANYTLTQREVSGRSVKRAMTLRQLETPQKDSNGIRSVGDRVVISFESPSDIAGTALLVHSNTKKNDDTWVYLPNLKRVKRISSANQSGNFAGTEFAYEDVATQEFYKFRYKWLRSEKCGTSSERAYCEVVEQVPAYKRSGYSRQVAYYDGCRQRKIEYYDRRDNLFKTQTFDAYSKYKGKYWRSRDNSMINHRNGRSTRLTIPSFDFGVRLSGKDFEPEALRFLR